MFIQIPNECGIGFITNFYCPPPPNANEGREWTINMLWTCPMCFCLFQKAGNGRLKCKPLLTIKVKDNLTNYYEYILILIWKL